jgi:hypothetical protein
VPEFGLGLDPPRRFVAVEHGHLDVHENEIGATGLSKEDSLLAASPEEPKRKDAPKMEVNVISLEERAKVEAKDFHKIRLYLQRMSLRPRSAG